MIEEIISMNPSLEGPLRFYEKAEQFTVAVKELARPSGTDLHAYPPDLIAGIMERFLSIFDLPEGNLAPLQQALEVGEIDFARIPLLEVPAFSLPYPEDDLTMLLFLLGRPFFHAQRERLRLDGATWQKGRCPVCRAQPSLSALAVDRGRLFCSFCGTVGRSDAITGCPICFNSEEVRSDTFSFEFDGFQIRTCDACRSYVKIVEEALLTRVTPDIADLMSLPLDIVIQNKGYRRRSPNPIGMLRMSENG